MSKPSFDTIYMGLAKILSERSHCVKKKVGAVITKEGRAIATGYNGPPENTYNCDEKWPEKGCCRTVRGGCFLSLHAEQNAIVFALKNKVDLRGSTLYITLSPCLPCARMIFSVGIIKLVYKESYSKFKGINIEEGLIFLKDLRVKIVCFKNKNL